MEYRDELWNNLNSLRSYLRSFNAVELVDKYYQTFGNEAPAILLEESIRKLEKHLDKAYDNKKKLTTKST